MKGKFSSLIIILIVVTISVILLLRTGPFEQPLWLQVTFLFFTSVFAYITFNNKSRLPFIILTICSLVTVSSLLIHFVL